MSDQQPRSNLESFGLKATWIYLIALVGGLPIAAYFELLVLKPISLNELGDFFAGAFGPLAIFWLVLGFFQQSRELQNSVDALNLQAEELKNSVEQQRALVGITKSQLDLDIEVREEQNRLSVSRELPFFQVHPQGSSGSSSGRTFNYQLRNIGADASEVHLSLNIDVVSYGPKDIQFLKHGQAFGFEITNDGLSNFIADSDTQLTLVSLNIRGQERTQVFRLGNFQPKLLSCKPEQI